MYRHHCGRINKLNSDTEAHWLYGGNLSKLFKFLINHFESVYSAMNKSIYLHSLIFQRKNTVNRFNLI